MLKGRKSYSDVKNNVVKSAENNKKPRFFIKLTNRNPETIVWKSIEELVQYKFTWLKICIHFKNEGKLWENGIWIFITSYCMGFCVSKWNNLIRCTVYMYPHCLNYFMKRLLCMTIILLNKNWCNIEVYCFSFLSWNQWKNIFPWKTDRHRFSLA